jgi:hypothetical protein
MIDKTRQRKRLTPVPQGRAPTWLLVAMASAVTAAALIARSLI